MPMDVTYYPTHLQSLALAGIILIALLSLGAWFYFRSKAQTRRLNLRFGPEYARTMDLLGGRKEAEAELKAREARVGRLDIVALSVSEAARFSQAWAELQARF